ncbi:MAG: alpha/beta hydrolase [Afipia sp.]|nr:alpha/beta hydrolase [Afipia sp.]
MSSIKAPAAENRALEQEYSTRAQIPDFEAIIEEWATKAATFRVRSRARLDIPYGDSPAETLDLFMPDDHPIAAVLFIRGGFWRSLDKSVFSSFAEHYVSRGAMVAVVNYGHSPAVRLKNIVEQVRGSAEWLFRHAKELGLARRSITIAAHSAGSHLGAMLVATDWSARAPDLPFNLVGGAVFTSGLYDLRPLVDLEFINKDIGLEIETATALSPALLKPANKIPVFAAVGQLESVAFRWQTEFLGRQWPDNVRDIIELEGLNHLATYDEMCRPGSELYQLVLGVSGLDGSDMASRS